MDVIAVPATMQRVGMERSVAVRQARYDRNEYARRGTTIYDRQVRPIVEPNNRGKIVAIDIDSGDFHVAKDSLSAAEPLLARRPDAQLWFVRIGHRGVHRFGRLRPMRSS